MQIESITKTINQQDYLIEFIDHTHSNLEALFRFRYDIFFNELGYTASESIKNAGIDKDVYDNFADYIIVTHVESQTLIASYRLIPYHRVPDNVTPYAACEFDISNILQAKKNIVELGRAAIHPKFRDGVGIRLLWRGLGEYALKNTIDYYAGLASMPESLTMSDIEIIFAYLRDNNFLSEPQFSVLPNPENAIQGFNTALILDNKAPIKRLIPSLLRGYLSVNTKICGQPALDLEFNVVDFYILLQLDFNDKKTQRFFYS